MRRKYTGVQFAGIPRDYRHLATTALPAQKWTEKKGLSIYCPLWGSGSVVDGQGREIDPGSLPKFVQEHISFLAPQGD